MKRPWYTRQQTIRGLSRGQVRVLVRMQFSAPRRVRLGIESHRSLDEDGLRLIVIVLKTQWLHI